MTTWTSRKAHRRKKVLTILRVVETATYLRALRTLGYVVAGCPYCRELETDIVMLCPACDTSRTSRKDLVRISLEVPYLSSVMEMFAVQASMIRHSAIHSQVNLLRNAGFLVVGCPECTDPSYSGPECRVCGTVINPSDTRAVQLGPERWLIVETARILYSSDLGASQNVLAGPRTSIAGTELRAMVKPTTSAKSKRRK